MDLDPFPNNGSGSNSGFDFDLESFLLVPDSVSIEKSVSSFRTRST